MSSRVDLLGCTVFDIYGANRIPVEGIFDQQRLADLFVEQWVPFIECHKCGRFDYCKFVQRHPKNPDLAIDIQCGVVASAIRVLVDSTFHLLLNLESDQRQGYLDAAFHYSQFVGGAELGIASCMNPDFAAYWGDFAPRLFSQLVDLRDHLDRMAVSLKAIPGFHSQKAVLLVEGWSEKVFLETLRGSHLSHILDLVVEDYGGTGNRRPRRIAMLLDRYERYGYKVFIQGDGDGGPQNIFDGLMSRNSFTDDQTFVFTYDFETAFPAALTFSTLQQMGELEAEQFETFEQSCRQHKGPVREILSRDYGIYLEGIKVPFAKLAADILNREDVIYGKDEELQQSELGRYLDWLMSVRGW